MSTHFQHGLFECCTDKDACLVTTFLPCFTLGKIAEVVGGNCFLYALSTFTCFYGYTGGKVRTAIRARYDIQGVKQNDFLVNCFCPCCSFVQEIREIKAHGDSPNQQFMARE